MAAEYECRLGFLALGSWCEAMPLGRQLTVYCLDVAVIAVSTLMCLTSVAVVANRSDHDRRAVSGLAVLSPPTEQ